jgi:uncharacterized membrane protein YjjB (DUF3815 family)
MTSFFGNAIAQLVFATCGTAAFAIITNVSRSVLLQCGLTGGIGWLIYWITEYLGANLAVSTLLGAIVIAILSTVFAKTCKMPMTVFNIPGIVPLVPGGLAYESLRAYAQADYNAFMATGLKVIMSAGAIAIGLLVGEMLNRNITKFIRKAQQIEEA